LRNNKNIFSTEGIAKEKMGMTEGMGLVRGKKKRGIGVEMI
jgi:hypothetical protein